MPKVSNVQEGVKIAPKRRKRLGLLSCTKKKMRGKEVRARFLYSASPFFKEYLAFLTACCDEVWIISARHGLVHLDTKLVPYEYSMIQRRKTEDFEEWIAEVTAGIAALNATEIVSCLSKEYGRVLEGLEVPIAHLHEGKDMFAMRAYISKLHTQWARTKELGISFSVG